MTTRILLQTTIVPSRNDWSIARFELLANFLREQSGRRRQPAVRRDRARSGTTRPDRSGVLSTLHRGDFDQMWLFAVDTGGGLRPEECEAISEFRRNGGGLLVTRDHMDLGSSVCDLDGVGAAHHFHTKNLDDALLLERDDRHTINIDWPNFHSGANGDYRARRGGRRHPSCARRSHFQRRARSAICRAIRMKVR